MASGRSRSGSKSGASGGSKSRSSSRRSSKTSGSRSKAKAQVTLNGRFRPGTRVRLYKVSGPEVLRHTADDELLAVKKVDRDGRVQFTAADGVEVDGRYILAGHVNGTPVDVRLRGREPDDVGAVTEQPPVGLSEVRFSDGRVVGERGGADLKVTKAAVPEHPDPGAKDFEQYDSSPPPASSAFPHEFPDERPAVPPHPEPKKK